jgi:hypothetical protein
MAEKLFGLVLLLCIALSASAAAPPKKQPNWSDLPAQQQQILAPLGPRWDTFTAQRKGMWLGIARKYPEMPAEEQAKVQLRMERWVELSQQERRTVREGYRNIQKLPPEKKLTLKQQWDEYNKLPEAERRRLSSGAKVPPPSSRKPSEANSDRR